MVTSLGSPEATGGFRRRWCAALAGALASLTLAGPAAATSLAVEVRPGPPPVGAEVEARLVISGLGSLASPSLGAFELQLVFDPSVLEVREVLFGDPLLGDQLALGFGSLSGSTVAADRVDVYEVSLAPAEDLDGSQVGTFAILRMILQAKRLGTSALVLSNVTLSDAAGDPLSASLEDASITVVPEPATLLLVSIGAVTLAVSRRGRGRSAGMLTTQTHGERRSRRPRG